MVENTIETLLIKMSQSTQSMQEGLDNIRNGLVKFLLEYLDTGVFRNRNNKTYVQAYTHVV